MHCVRKVTEDLYWVGANEHRLALFENVHPLTKGVSYNSYLLMDEKTVLFDTVDWAVCRQFIDNIAYVLNGKKLDYMIINHMEPDHAACIQEVLLRYPETKVISTEKAFMFMDQFGFVVPDGQKIQVKEGDSQKFGKHEIHFIAAQMVHWPEAMVSFDATNGVLFSADAFGTFIALDGKLFADEVNFDRDWLDEARRYYTNIVGKYGPHVQHLLKKAGGIIDKIKILCPLHGPVWRKDLGYILEKYDKWSTYVPEEKGVLIVYATMYGNTEETAGVLAAKLADRGITNIVMHDVSSTHVSYLISDTFKLSHVVLASVTYNLNIYPPIYEYLHDMKALNLQKRKFALIENGSWAPKSGTLMQEFIENNLKQSEVLDAQVSVSSSMKEANVGEMDALVDALVESIKQQK